MSIVATPATVADSSKDRVRRHREAMRAKGYRIVTLWLPDARRPGFVEECQKQSKALKKSAAEKRYLAGLDLPDVEGWS